MKPRPAELVRRGGFIHVVHDHAFDRELARVEGQAAFGRGAFAYAALGDGALRSGLGSERVDALQPGFIHHGMVQIPRERDGATNLRDTSQRPGYTMAVVARWAASLAAGIASTRESSESLALSSTVSPGGRTATRHFAIVPDDFLKAVRAADRRVVARGFRISLRSFYANAAFLPLTENSRP